jgi:hypothetical protein
MKFKEYLKEYIKTNDGKEWEGMLRYRVPIKPGFFKEKRGLVYRIAGENSPNNIKKNEGKKKEFSGFTKGSEPLSKGIFSGGAYIYELDANIVYDHEKDIFSQIDRNGYKWFDSVPFYKKIKPLVLKYFGEKTDKKDVMKIDMLKYLNQSGNNKKDFIKWYFDISKKLLKDKKLINDIYNEVIVPMPVYTNDEVIFNNYTVKGAYIITDIIRADKKTFEEDVVNLGSSAFYYENDPKPVDIIKERESLEDGLKKANIKYLGTLMREDIVYIDVRKNRTAERYAFFPDFDKIKKEFERRWKADYEDVFNYLTQDSNIEGI